QLGQQVVVDLVAVAVAFDNHIGAIAFAGLTAGFQRTLLGAQAHGAAKVGGLVAGLHFAGSGLPLGDQADYGVLGGLVELGGVGIVPAQHIAGEFDDSHLHAQADAQIGDLVLAGIAHGGDLAFHAAQAEAAGHQDGIHVFQLAGAILLDGFRVDIAHVDLGAALDAGVAQGLDQRLVGV